MPLPIEKQLFEAIQKLDEELVRTVLAKMKKCNEELEQTETLKAIIKQPASIEAKDEKGYTPLIQAAKEGHAGIVQALLENGAIVDNPTNNGTTPLMTAALNGYRDCINLLIEAKANLDAKGVSERTPLMYAAAKGALDGVQVLLDHKAALNNRDTSGQTALILASIETNPDTVAALLLAGADPTIKDNHEKTADQHALNLECHDMLTDPDYFKSPMNNLFRAVRLNNIPLLKEAITTIKKMNNELKEHPSITDIMDQSIPSIDAIIQEKTPLILAAKLNRTECLKVLINNKADLNINADGTALVWAVYKKHYDCTKLLCESDRVDFNAKDNDGNTALMYAVSNADESCITLLAAAKGINLNAKNKNGITALMKAASNEVESGIKTLLEKKEIDVNAKDCDGHTALIYAERANRESCVELLRSAIKKQEALHPPLMVDSPSQTLPIEHPPIVDSKPETAWPTLNSIWSLFNPNNWKEQLYTELPHDEEEELTTSKTSSLQRRRTRDYNG